MVTFFGLDDEFCLMSNIKKCFGDGTEDQTTAIFKGFSELKHRVRIDSETNNGNIISTLHSFEEYVLISVHIERVL